MSEDRRDADLITDFLFADDHQDFHAELRAKSLRQLRHHRRRRQTLRLVIAASVAIFLSGVFWSGSSQNRAPDNLTPEELPKGKITIIHTRPLPKGILVKAHQRVNISYTTKTLSRDRRDQIIYKSSGLAQTSFVMVKTHRTQSPTLTDAELFAVVSPKPCGLLPVPGGGKQLVFFAARDKNLISP